MASQEGCRDVGDTRAGAGLSWWARGGSAAAALVPLCSWLQAVSRSCA